MSATALLQPLGATGAPLASISGRPGAPLAPQQPPSALGHSGRRRRLAAAAPPHAQSVGYEGRQAAAPPSVSPRPFGVPPGSFVQQRGPAVVPQRGPPPPPPSLQPQVPHQQHAASAAALAGQRQAAAAQAAAAAAQQQQQQPGPQPIQPQQQFGQQPTQQQQQQQQPTQLQQQQQQQASPMAPEMLAAVNKMVANTRRAAAAARAAGDLNEHERQRRLKISQANKGRTPWNKGRRHPPETIARIKEATKQAMQRADVRERLQKANEKREPHSNEAKEKIRAKLLERANTARHAINEQAEAIVARLRASEDPAWREAGEYDQAVEVVAGLAWQYFKKDWSQVSTSGWESHPEFSQRCIQKLLALVEKKRMAAVPKKRKVDKVKKALDTFNKLEGARKKVADAENMLGQLRRAKEHPLFASDPEKLAGLLEAEAKADAVVLKLQKQVAKLEAALQPLQEYLEPELAHGGGAAAHLSLEERLEADAAAREAAAPQAAAGEQDSINGHAAPGRSPMPWQR